MVGSGDLQTLGDILKIGTVAALSLFMLVYFFLLRSADSPSEAVDIFGRTFYTMVFLFIPTSVVGVFFNFIGGAIAAAISIDKLNLKVIGAIIAFSFGWTSVNIIMNWYTAPI